MDNSKQVNVLWLVEHVTHDGIAMHGAGTYYLNTINNFKQSRFNIALYTLRGRNKFIKYFEDQGIRIKCLGRSKFDLLTLFDVINIVKKEKINLIHAHGYGSDNFGRLVSRVCGVPIVVHTHDNCIYYPWYQGIADRLLRQFTNKAIAVSNSVKEACVMKRKMDTSKISVMHNGIDLDKFTVPEENRIEKERNRLGIKSGFKVVGTVARLREEKGIRYLIESVPKVLEYFEETTFLIVGDGPLRQEFEKLSNQLGVENKVIFAGFCQDIPAIQSLLDICVMPSLTEGSPIALLEAMAMGKTIVGTKINGIKDILKNNINGLLVPSKDSDLLADSIIYLLKHEEEAKKLGIEAKAESQKYDMKKYISSLEKLYSELLSVKY